VDAAGRARAGRRDVESDGARGEDEARDERESGDGRDTEQDPKDGATVRRHRRRWIENETWRWRGAAPIPDAPTQQPRLPPGAHVACYPGWSKSIRADLEAWMEYDQTLICQEVSTG